jgi:hypothetical protein
VRPLLVCAAVLGAILGCPASAGAAGVREQAQIFTVRSAQAELRGRPSVDATVMGLVRRGEEVEFVRSSADRRWIEVEIGGGELAWIEARALKPGAATPEPERRDTLRMDGPSVPRLDDDRRSREEPRVVRDEPPPRPEPRVVRNEPPPKPEPRVARNEPPPKPEPRVVRNEPPAPPKQVPEQAPEPRLAGRPMRDIPAAKPGELFAAELDDERPPSGPDATPKRTKK